MMISIISHIGEIVVLTIGFKILFSSNLSKNCQLFEPHLTFVQFFVTLYTVI